MQRSHESAENALLQLTAGVEEERAARDREVEALSLDAEAAQRQLASVSHDNSKLEEELARLRQVRGQRDVEDSTSVSHVLLSEKFRISWCGPTCRRVDPYKVYRCQVCDVLDLFSSL